MTGPNSFIPLRQSPGTFPSGLRPSPLTSFLKEISCLFCLFRGEHIIVIIDNQLRSAVLADSLHRL